MGSLRKRERLSEVGVQLGPGQVVVRLHLQDFNDQDVIRGGAFDPEWSDLAREGAASGLVVVAVVRA